MWGHTADAKECSGTRAWDYKNALAKSNRFT
jgi:hypothetical protein